MILIFKILNIIKLSFRFEPIKSLKLLFLRIIQILVPIARLYIITEIINNVQNYILDKGRIDNLIIFLVLLATLEILNGVIQVINRYENRRMLILLNTKHYPILIEKISKLKS